MNEQEESAFVSKTATTTPNIKKARHVERMISNLLFAGVIVSMFFIVFGTGVSFFHHPEYTSHPWDPGQFDSKGNTFPHTLRDVVQGLFAFKGQSFIVTGLLILIATPVVRVFASIVGFIHVRDWRYVIITTIVLGLLFFSFLIGAVE